MATLRLVTDRDTGCQTPPTAVEAACAHLVGHLCALPLNLCDLLYIKDRALLLHYVLSLRTNVAIGFAYGFLYVSVLR